MIEIRSYRRVFELERRIYRVDRLRLNPGGVPIRGVVYFLALLVASMVAAALPVLGEPLRVLPWYLRALLLPGLLAGLLALIRVEGRPFHLTARSMIAFVLSARGVVGLLAGATVGKPWLPPDIVLLPDGSDARLRRLSYTGPGAALVATRHERIVNPQAKCRNGRWPRRAQVAVTLRAIDSRPANPRREVVVLARGARLRSTGA
jgi:hypothetical protein